MKRKILFLAIGVGLLMLLCWAVTTQTMLLKCQTDSLSGIRYLLIKKGSSFERGDIVCLRDHRSQYVEGNKPLAKRILGIPGDLIQRKDNLIKIIPQDESFPSSPLFLLSATSKGEPLRPLSLKIIPEGYMFVAGDHPKSFDSRYEEFGLVKIENISGRALWWW